MFQQVSNNLSIFDNVGEIYANLDKFILLSTCLNKLDHFGQVIKNLTLLDKSEPFYLDKEKLKQICLYLAKLDLSNS